MEIKVIITLTAIMLLIIGVTPSEKNAMVEEENIEVYYDTIGVYKYVSCVRSNQQLKAEIEKTKRELCDQIIDQSNIIDTLQFRNYGAK
jgi:hypothetical protein